MAWSQPRQHKNCFVPGPRAAHSADLIGNKLFLFGGWNGKKALNDLHILDVDQLTDGECPQEAWTEAFPIGTIPATRNNHISVIVHTTKVFIHGGHDGGKWLNDLHILDTERMSWVTPSVAGTCPQARACHTLTLLDRKLIMFGGYDGSRCFSDVDILDLDTMTWRQPHISGIQPLARNAHTMTNIGGKLYLFAGHSGSKHLQDLHILDTEAMCWSQPKTMGVPPRGLRGHSATLIGQTAFIFGGYDGRGRSNALHLLNLASLTWQPKQPQAENTPTGRQRHSATLVGSSRLVIFGGFDGFKWLNDLHVLDVGNLEARTITSDAERKLLSSMRRLINNPDLFTDIIFIVEGQPIHAHKAVLAAQCQQFHAMFSSGMRESTQTEIMIQGEWSHLAFLAMLEFLYTGTGPDTAELALDLIGLADQFTLDGLKRLCENLLVHHVDVDNVCALLSRAHKFNATGLKKVCFSFMVKHWDPVCDTSGYEALVQEPQLLLEVTKQTMARANSMTER